MIQAIILAAGRGSRLKGFTEDKPKCLNAVAGKPLLQWQMQSLQAAGLSEIGAVTGYMNESIEKFPLTTKKNHDWSTTNMVFSLSCALDILSPGTIVSYSDILYGPSAVRALVNHPGNSLKVLYDTDWRTLWERRSADPLSDTENFQITKNGRVEKIGGRASSMESPQGQYMGLIRLSEEFLFWFQALCRNEEAIVRKIDMTSLLQRFISEGGEVTGVPTKGNWMEVDTEADLAMAEKMILAKELNPLL